MGAHSPSMAHRGLHNRDDFGSPTCVVEIAAVEGLELRSFNLNNGGLPPSVYLSIHLQSRRFTDKNSPDLPSSTPISGMLEYICSVKEVGMFNEPRWR